MTRGFTADDVLAIQLTDDPQISPDGAHIAFVRAEIDRNRYEYHHSIWLAPTKGGEPRRLTNGPGDSSPRWSPDGRTLAFLRGPAAPAQPKTREERDAGKTQAQLWLLPLEGGEPRQLTSLRHGAGAAVWAPDGGSIAFAAQTGHADDEAVDDAALDDKTFPRVRTIDQLWHKLDGEGYIYELRSHLFSVPVGGGEPRQLTDGDWNDGEVSWSPEGRTLAFTSDRNAERWTWPASSVWTLDLVGGALKRLTDEALGAGAPSWSPDGKQIAFVGSPRRGGFGHSDLYVVAADQAEPGQRQLSADFTPDCSDSCIDDQRAHGVHHLGWSADNHDILLLASARGSTHVYAFPADGASQPRQLTSGDIHVYAFTEDRAAQTLALAIATPRIPGDIFTQSLAANADAAPRRLTEVNAALLAEVEIAEPEEFTYTGADGWELQGWTLRPPQSDREHKLPTILEVHGGPAAMYGHSFFLEFQLLAARGYAVVYVNPRGSTGYGRTFTSAVIKDWGGKDFDDIMAGLDAAIARGGIDPERVGIAGGSYGGFMTNWALGHSDRFKAGVTMRCVSNMATMFGVSDVGWSLAIDELDATPWDDLDALMRFSPISYVKNIHAPLLILHSDNDLRCPLEQGQQVYSALKFLGQTTRLVIFEGQSHDLSRNGHPRSRVRRLNEIVGWFEQYIPA
ncbi:MAG TPA: S9 family peptidase [Ktedonobacterales bacterium]|nr:S9 family peptidase [Ktedonobacterales bacterium]